MLLSQCSPSQPSTQLRPQSAASVSVPVQWQTYSSKNGLLSLDLVANEQPRTAKGISMPNYSLTMAMFLARY